MLKRGFTLAEVLITIGVIGVVASLTIPSLSTQYQKRVLTTQLQKAYAEISQAAAMAIAEDMSADFEGSRAFRNNNFVNRYIPKSRETWIEGGFAQKYKNLWDSGETNVRDFEPRTYSCAVANAGYSICFGRNSNNQNYGIIDVNGTKGPNKMGVDFYRIFFKKNGRLIGYGGELIRVMDNDWDIDF